MWIQSVRNMKFTGRDCFIAFCNTVVFGFESGFLESTKKSIQGTYHNLWKKSLIERSFCTLIFIANGKAMSVQK